MRRVNIDQRPNAARLVASQGLVYSQDLSDPNIHYWPDDRYYSFTQEEINLLHEATDDVFDMCCEAAGWLTQPENQHVMTEKMAIPAFAIRQIVESWNRDPGWGSIYGRFDVCFGGLDHPEPRLRVPKFYEFNADTPTSLVESAAIQWTWLEQTGHGSNQFNSISEDLVKAWKRNMPYIEQVLGHRPVVHFAVSRCDNTGEDAMNVTLMLDTCRQAGWEVKTLFIEQIGLGKDGRFYDQHNEHIDVIFKLWPWEFLAKEQFGQSCFKDMENIGLRNEHDEYIGGTIWMEPPYKMLWSNKAIMVLLWQLFKDDPRSKWLLPAYFEEEAPEGFTDYVRKPIYSREGLDVEMYVGNKVVHDTKMNAYGKEGSILQEMALLPTFYDDREDKHWYPVLGLWVVDGDPAGMSIREDVKPISTTHSPFAPHSIEGVPINYERQPVPSLEEIEASLQPGIRYDVEKDELFEYIYRVIGEPQR